jgi:serine/threonine protein kinase
MSPINNVEVIGSHLGRTVAKPARFTPATIISGNCQVLNVLTANGEVIESTCLTANDRVYEIQASVFKNSLYGSVHRGWTLQRDGDMLFRSSDRFDIAIKKFSKLSMRHDARADDPLQEFAALQHIGDSHPNVMGQIACIEDSHNYYSIMTFCKGGELCSKIMGDGPEDEVRGRHLFRQLLDGLQYIHSKGVFHRDISLENILVDDNDHLVIIDFGMCLLCPNDPQNITSYPYLLPSCPAKGKRSYMAPEIVSQEDPFDAFAADIWSLGITLFVMLTSKFIVTHASPLCKLFRHVRAGRLKDMIAHWQINLSSPAQDLLHHMICANPEERWTIEQIKAHPWMNTTSTQS